MSRLKHFTTITTLLLLHCNTLLLSVFITDSVKVKLLAWLSSFNIWLTLTAPHGPVLHCDCGRPSMFWSALAMGSVFFRESGYVREFPWCPGWDGHWGMAQSCSDQGRSSWSHSTVSTGWSLKFTHWTWREARPWPHETEHCVNTNVKEIRDMRDPCWMGTDTADCDFDKWTF